MSGCNSNPLLGRKVKVYSDYNHKTLKYEGVILCVIQDKLIIKKEKGHLATEYPNNCQLLEANENENS